MENVDLKAIKKAIKHLEKADFHMQKSNVENTYDLFQKILEIINELEVHLE